MPEVAAILLSSFFLETLLFQGCKKKEHTINILRELHSSVEECKWYLGKRYNLSNKVVITSLFPSSESFFHTLVSLQFLR